MDKAQKLYDAVKSGRIKLEDLNEQGKETLRQHMGISQNTPPKPKTNEADRYTGSNKFLQKAQSGLDFVNRLGQKTADTFLLTDREQYTDGKVKYTPVATPTQEKVTDIGGAILGSVVPYGGIYKGLGLIGNKLPAAAQAVNPLVKTGVKGGIAGGTYETAVGVGHGEKPKEIVKRAAIGTAAGVLGDVAITKAPQIIRAMKEANQMNAVRGLDLRDPVKTFKATSPNKPRGTRSGMMMNEIFIPQRATRSGGIVETTKPQKIFNDANIPEVPKRNLLPKTQAEAEARFNDVIGGIQQSVRESMIPPIEQKRQLVNYIHEGMDGQISKNEIGKMNYQQLAEMAQDIAGQRSKGNLWDMAVNEAKKRDIDLDELQKMASKPGYAEDAFKWSIVSGHTKPGDYISDALAKMRQPGGENALKELAKSFELAGVPKPAKRQPNSIPGNAPNLASLNTPKRATRSGFIMNETLPKIEPSETAPKATPEQAKPIMPQANTRPVPDTTKNIVSKTNRPTLNIPALINKGYMKSVDNLQRVNQLDRYTEKVTGKKLSPSDRAYFLALNSRGADMASSHILEERLINAKGDQIGSPLKSITMQIPKNNIKQFEDYMIHRHAPSWMEKGKKVFRDELGVTPEVSAGKVVQYENQFPEFQKLGKEWDKWWQDFGQSWLVDTGMMSQKMWNNWRKAHPHYVKLQRQMAEVEKTRWSLGKRATGSERPIISPLESAIEDIDHIVKLAKRNEALQAIYRQIEKNPDDMKAWGEIVKEEPIPVKQETKPTSEIDDEIEQILTEVDNSFEQAKINPKHGNNVIVKVSGKPIQIRVYDKDLLDALTSINPKGQGALIEAARQITRQVKNLTTGINPVFSLARNIFRDIPMSYIASKSTNNPLTFSKDLVGSFVSVIKNDELYKSFKAIGGGHASSVSADRNLLAESKARILPGYIDPSKPFQAVNRVAGKGISYLERLNNTIEAAPRLAEYKRFSKNGNYADRVRGLYEANDITVNFKRHSDLSREIDAVIMYFNAAVQGLDKSFRIYKDNPVQASLKSFFAVTVPTLLLYAINHNDENYRRLSNYIKDSYFLFPKGDGTFVKIPKSREVGTVWGSGVERILRKWKENDPNAFDDFAETVKTNFLPPTRSIAHPLIRDIPANKDFVNRPIVPGYLQNVSPRYQYDEKTSAPAKFIGDKLNVSPKQLDYAVKSYTGFVGQLGIPATAPGSTVGKTLKSQVTADPLYSNDTVNNFYAIKEKLDTANADFKATRVRPAEFNEPMRKLFNRLASKISEIRKAIRQIQSDKKLTEKQKDAKIRKLQSYILDISSKATETYGKRGS